MGQQEVLDFLEKQEEPLTSGEIAFMMKENPNKINMLLKKLIHSGDINYIEVNKDFAYKRCGAKRRIKLYYYHQTIIKNISLMQILV